MFGTINCIYETPYGWCSKWDKKCDNKIPEQGQITKCNPVYVNLSQTTNGNVLEYPRQELLTDVRNAMLLRHTIVISIAKFL